MLQRLQRCPRRLAIGYIKKRTVHTSAPTKQMIAKARLPCFANTSAARSSATDKKPHMPCPLSYDTGLAEG